MAKRVVSPHSTGNCTQSLPLEHSTAGLDVGAHCICARVGTCDFHCRGRPIAALTMRWRFVGVDLLIDPSAQRPGRGGGMRACRPTVRYTQKIRLAKSKSDFFVLALPIFLCRQSIVPPAAGPDVLCRICMRKATCRWQVAFQMLALPIFPCSRPQSIVGEGELNFCVRDGNRWTLTPINTNCVEANSVSFASV